MSDIVVQTGEVYQGIQPIERYNTLSGWCRLLSDNGLAPFRIVKYEMPRPYTLHDLVWYGLRPAKTVHLFLALFLPLAFGELFCLSVPTFGPVQHRVSSSFTGQGCN